MELVGHATADFDFGSGTGSIDRSNGVGVDVARFADVEPGMAVDAAAFIEPAFLQSGVGADGYYIVTAEIDIGGHVVALSDISARLAAEIESIEPDFAVAENAVEHERNAFGRVGSRHGEHFAVPADRRSGIFIAHGLITVAVACILFKRKVDHEVEGEVDADPCRIVEFHGVRPHVMDRGCFGQIVEIFCSGPEILGRVGVAEGEAPSAINIHKFGRQRKSRGQSQ